MDQQVSQQMEQNLRQQWDQLYPQILDRFTTVSKADIESARSSDDLVRRIADKSGFSERQVENTLHELVTVGAGQARSSQQRPFSTHQQTPGAGSTISQQGQQGQQGSYNN